MKNFEIIREKLSSRGGGIEIDLTNQGFPGEKMSAYQNYLGGGMLGAIQSNNTIQAFNKKVSEKNIVKLNKIAEELKKLLHEKTNPEEDEWSGSTYEENQNRPTSGY